MGYNSLSSNFSPRIHTPLILSSFSLSLFFFSLPQIEFNPTIKLRNDWMTQPMNAKGLYWKNDSFGNSSGGMVKQTETHEYSAMVGMLALYYGRWSIYLSRIGSFATVTWKWRSVQIPIGEDSLGRATKALIKVSAVETKSLLLNLIKWPPVFHIRAVW